MAGIRPTYQSTDERPVSVSLRIPKALYDQAQQWVRLRRMTLTEALLAGLQLWLETPTDPRDLVLTDVSNTVIQQLQEMGDAAVQHALAREREAPACAALAHRSMCALHPPPPARRGLQQCGKGQSVSRHPKGVPPLCPRAEAGTPPAPGRRPRGSRPA